MYHTIEKNGESRQVKEKYLQNFIERGWKVAGEKSKPAKPKAKIVEAEAEVKPIEDVPAEEIISDEWAEEANTNEGEA